MQFVFNAFAEFYNLFGNQSSFLLCFTVAFVAFLVTLALSVFLRGYGAQKRFYLVYFLAGVCLLDFGLELALGGKVANSLALIGVSICFSSIIFSIREKKRVSDEQRDLVKFIEEKINENQDDIEDYEDCLNPKGTQTIQENVGQGTREIDFSRVKQILEKISTINLSSTERNQIKDLEDAVSEAEFGEVDSLIKEKINDGLSALLKIMANHGV